MAVLGLVGCLFAGSSVAEAATPGGSARRTTPSVNCSLSSDAQSGALLARAPSEVRERVLASSEVAGPDMGITLRPLAHAMSFHVGRLGDKKQLIGVSQKTGSVFSVAFEPRMSCAPQTSAVAQINVDGSATLGLETGTVQVAAPWAFDSDGHALPTWYTTTNDGNIVQTVDATRAKAPVFFDPTYTPFTCPNGYWSNLSAGQYLDMYAPTTDYGYCAPAGLFNARNGYLPVWAFEANVANDYGKVPVYQNGGCSWSPDTGFAWDFQLPCKAHDYCYDLRKAGFSGTVSDGDCDSWFYGLMEAHCNNRVLAADCRLVRDTFYQFVAAPGVVTDPDPAAVSVKAVHSGKCADVTASSLNDGVPIVQYTCTGTANQKFKFWPAPGAPGYFQAKPTHSNKCADINISNNQIAQYGCGNFAEQRFKIQGSQLQNIFTLRSQFHSNTFCWDVPASSLNFVQLIEYGCSETSNERWILA